MQFVYARVYRIPTSVDRRYKIFKATILLWESWANKLTNFGINEAFYILSRAILSKERL